MRKATPTRGVRIVAAAPSLWRTPQRNTLPAVTQTRQAVVIREVDFVADVLEGAKDLVLAHWREVCLRHDLFPLDPHLDRYRSLQQLGFLLALGAFVGDEMVGYCASFVMPHLHYQGTLVCQNDVIYVTPEHRANGVGARLMLTMERKARDAGASVVSWHAKPGKELHNALRNPKHGYWVQDIVYCREI